MLLPLYQEGAIVGSPVEPCLEGSFDRNLERSWAALVIERAGIPEALIEHLSGLAKKKVRERRIDIPEVGMIEHVERLDLQLQIQSFG
jgi:hypothetical protein